MIFNLLEAAMDDRSYTSFAFDPSRTHTPVRFGIDALIMHRLNDRFS
jgi:hypothetical protein